MVRKRTRSRYLPRVYPSLLLSLGLLWVATSHRLAAQETFTPELLAKLRSVTGAEISPDGSQVAYLLDVPRRVFKDKDGPAWTELHVVDRQGVSRPYVTGEINVGSIAWTPDGLSISYLARRGNDSGTSLYVIPLAGGESRRVLTHSNGIRDYSWSPDGRRVAFSGTEQTPGEQKKRRDQGFIQQAFEEGWQPVKVWIAEPDLSDAPNQTGASKESEEEKKPRLLELEGSASQFRWSPQGDLLAVALAPTPSADDAYMNRKVSIVNIASGEVLGRIETAGKIGSFRWSPDAKRLALIAAADRHDPREGRLMVASAQGGEPRDLLPDLKGHVTSIEWRDKDTLLYAADIGVGSALGEIRADGSRPKIYIPADDGRVFSSLSYAPQGKSLTLLADTARHPSEVFLLPLGERRPKQLTASNPGLKRVRFASQEVVSFQAADGLALQGILVRPLEEEAGKRYPLILSVHGGPESHVSNGWVTSYANPGQVAAARGFAVFYPNYRGSTGRGVEFSKLDHGDPAGAEFDDLIAAVDHLIEAGLADRERVGITGGSYGGYASAWGATRYTERFAASVVFAGISDEISKFGATDIPEEIYLVHHRRHVWEDWQFFLERSPIYYAKQSRTPTLILHGTVDPRVPPNQPMELYRFLKLVGKAPVRLVFYPGEGHGNRRASSRYDYNLRMLRWMEHYLKGPGGEPPPEELDYEPAKKAKEESKDQKEDEKEKEKAQQEK